MDIIMLQRHKYFDSDTLYRAYICILATLIKMRFKYVFIDDLINDDALGPQIIPRV
jgi:hypothetical protein